MIILGLHFGHDAAAAVTIDGAVGGYVLRERHSRVKHALGLTRADIDLALARAGVTIADIDACAVTSTQNVELLVRDADDLSFEWGTVEDHAHPGVMFESLGLDALKGRTASTVLDLVYGTPQDDQHLYKFYTKLFPEHRDMPRDAFSAVAWLDDFLNLEIWSRPAGLDDIAGADLSGLLQTDDLRKGFHFPARLMLGGRTIPAYAVHHHMCHAASVFYRSGLEQAAIMTHDGFSRGEGYQSGLFYFGDGHKIFPLMPHHLQLGGLYDQVAATLGLGEVGGAGKLMGLAPYGDPHLYRPEFAGNRYDGLSKGLDLPDAWLGYLATELDRRGVDVSKIGDPRHILDKAAVDIAAATQKLFEQSALMAVKSLKSLLKTSGRTVDALCMTGGTALNCPANSLIAREAGFTDVHIEPCCDDGGLAIGAALHLHHNVFDAPRDDLGDRYQTSYLGAPYLEHQVRTALDARGDTITWEKCDTAARAAEDLAANKVIAWFEGGSEAGPRALGHRSILSNPMDKGNWERVNEVKHREKWRPFAPAVLEERAHEWFSGCPLPSPYMLFTADVVRDDVPAITHVDGSSRIQTVASGDGGYRRVIEAFAEKTGVPVVMNTSFNGPGEPIVETPDEALVFLLKSTIDTLYMDGYRVKRCSMAKGELTT